MFAWVRAYLFIDPLICLATMVFGSVNLVVSFFDRPDGSRQFAVARAWARTLCRLAGVRLTIEGMEHLEPGKCYVLTANHLSYMDTPVVLGHLPVPFRFMAKKGLFQVPFLGNHLERAGHLPVVLDNPREGVKLLGEAARLMRERNTSVLIFPEGGRAADGKLQEFKDGAFYLAIKGGIPVVPITLIGTWEMLPFGSGLMKPGPVKMCIAPPIDTAAMTTKDRMALSAQVRGIIAARLAG